MYEYIENVCNFLNNTRGCIEDYEIKFLLDTLFDRDFNLNLISMLSDSNKKMLNEDIECDIGHKFYEDLYSR